MALYDILQFLHVTAAMVWVGGSVTVMVLHARLSTADAEAARTLAHQGAAIGTRVFAPAAILTLLAGIAAAVVGTVGTPLWVIWGLAVVALSILLSGVAIRSLSARLLEALQARDPGAPRLRRALRLVGLANLALLLSAVWAMVAKPV